MRSLSQQEKDALEQYFQICKRIFDEFERNDSWPWEDDSPNTEYLVDLDGNKNEP